MLLVVGSPGLPPEQKDGVRAKSPAPAPDEEVASHTTALRLMQEVKGEGGERMVYLLSDAWAYSGGVLVYRGL